MIEMLLIEKDERGAAKAPPHLSYSRINRYLHCPEQYRLYYIEKLRPRFPSAAMVFGQVMHAALALFFLDGGRPGPFFDAAWDEVRQIDLTYNQKESWEKLKTIGPGLLQKFQQDFMKRISRVAGVEKPFEIRITSLNMAMVGAIDLIAAVDGKNTVLDFKTSGSSYEKHEVALSDQLTAYQLAEPGAEQTGLCVLVKTKDPKVEWHLSSRNGNQITEFLDKAEYVAREITANRFYKRSGMWCSWCDYLPVCVMDKQKTKETLVRIN
jgi:putative RecB family exonuclease